MQTCDTPLLMNRGAWTSTYSLATSVTDYSRALLSLKSLGRPEPVPRLPHSTIWKVHAFSQTKAALDAALPQTLTADLLGRNFVTSQVRLIQPLWTHGKLRSRYQQAKAGAAIANNDIVETENEVAFNVSRAYLLVVLSDELYTVANEASGYAESVEQTALALAEEDDEYVTMADVLRVRTFRALFQEQAVGMQVSRERALVGLKLAMGVLQSDPLQIADHRLPTDHCSTNLDILKQQAFSQRPELRKLGLATTVADLEHESPGRTFSLTLPHSPAIARSMTTPIFRIPTTRPSGRWA